MTRSTLLAVLAFSTLTLFAQVPETKQAFVDAFYLDPTLREAMQPRHAPMMMEGGFPRKDIDMTLDVLSYELWMDWVDALTIKRSDRGPRKVEARLLADVRISSVAAVPVSTITLDAVSLLTDSVKVNGVTADMQQLTSTLVITLPAPVAPGETFTLEIFYAIGRDTRGFNAFSPFEADTLGLLEPIAFTFSQPEDARRWFPCNDKPHDKAVFTVHVRVPQGFTAVSNGMRTDSTADSDTTSWQTWHEPSIMPTYLFAVSASRYHRYDQEATLQNGTTIPIMNYHWLADHDGEQYNAVGALANIPEMFVPFEKAFGPYPLATYGHMTVAPIQFGGMEHQTMSTINRRWLRGDVELGYAHELAHQWLGDEVTCATWADIWLNEGGASFGEALWWEHLLGPEGYDAVMLSRRARYLRRGLDEPPVYDIPIGFIFNEATTYSKSAWVYHMMRRMVGDSVFFAALQAYVREYSFGAAQTADLMEVMQREIPTPIVPWDTFFNQWLYQAGHPQYVGIARMNTIPENGEYLTYITIRQVQSKDGVPDVFDTPVTLRLRNAEQSVEVSLHMQERVQQVQIYVPFQPDTLEIDPHMDILCETSSTVVTSVSDEADQPLATITSAVPAVRGTLVTASVQPGSRVRVVTMDGRTLVDVTEPNGLVALSSAAWPLGVVALAVEHHGQIQTFTLPIID